MRNIASIINLDKHVQRPVQLIDYLPKTSPHII